MLDFLISLPPITWLFIALCVIAIFFIRLIWSARNKWMLSTSPGARERFNYQITFGSVGLLIVLIVMLGVFINSQLAFSTANLSQDITTPPPVAAQITPATFVALLPTPTPTSTPVASPTPTATTSPTPTLMPTLPPPTPPPTDTPTPQPPPTSPPPSPTPDLSQGQLPNCPHSGARIIRPGDGAQVEGIIEIYGAASIENFDYYKFEFRGPGQDWSYIQHFENPVAEGTLGQWNTDTVPPGTYEFRLVVVDTLGNYPEPCTIRLAVQ
jgi:hypothetical protein